MRSIVSAAVFAGVLVTPVVTLAQSQYDHDVAKSQVEAKDAHHHNKAKIVGGSAVGGAVVGGLVGGGTGAAVGAAAGAGGGVLANRARKHNSIKKQEDRNAGYPNR